MEEYNYEKNMKQDIIELVDSYGWPETGEEFYNMCEDELWADDSITGNGGGYYDNSVNCAEYISRNLPLAIEAMNDFGVETKNLPRDDRIYQHLDSLIRCYLFEGVVADIMNEKYPED